jgi:lysophospholipase L1-like esterase
LLALGGTLTVEVYLALNAEYLPTTPALDVGGTFGDPGDPPLTFVVLGDSTAAGVGAGNARAAYPSLLAEELAAGGRAVHLVDLGVSGARVGDVLTDQLPRAVDAEPDLVFLGIGANDATHLTRLADVLEDTTAILATLRQTGALVVVAGAPDMRAAAFLEPLRTVIGWRGRRVAETIERVARSMGIPVVPLAAETGHYFAADPARYYAADDFHPSAEGYVLWARAIYPVLERALVGS